MKVKLKAQKYCSTGNVRRRESKSRENITAPSAGRSEPAEQSIYICVFIAVSVPDIQFNIVLLLVINTFLHVLCTAVFEQ